MLAGTGVWPPTARGKVKVKIFCSKFNVNSIENLAMILTTCLFTDAPVCSSRQRFLYGVAKREPIQVPCTVEADPSVTSFRWSFNNTINSVPINTFVDSLNDQPSSSSIPTTSSNTLPVSLSATSVATYVPKNKYGYGQLLCWATNELGEQAQPCVFNIIPAGQPSPLRNCMVYNQSLEGFTVGCLPGDDGGLEQQFYLEVFQADQGQLIVNLTQSGGTIDRQLDDSVEFTVTEVPAANSFVLVLYAANAKGRSNYVTLSAQTVPQGGRGSGMFAAILF